jgi:hypothetical protein
MGKNPSFQYYPKDWQTDPIFACSLAARGLWHEMMNVMHGCEPYGYLSENGKPMPDERIARRCGTTLPEYIAILSELDAAGIPRRTAAGILYSKRMVEDEKQRKDWRNRQKKHRDASKPVTHDVTQVSRGSPSSSASPTAIQREPHRSALYFSRKEQETESERSVGGGVVVEEHCSRSNAINILEVIAEAKRRGIPADELMKERRATGVG